MPQAANARTPLHTTKAPLLQRENSNARVTKAEEAPAAEHREEDEGSDKAIISCTYRSLCSKERLYKTLTGPQFSFSMTWALIHSFLLNPM
jgi:hypothetical protein